MFKVDYDKDGDILEIFFADRIVDESEYIDETGIIVDYDSAKNIIGIQITSFSKRVPNNEFINAIAV
jgi:uncharacterized protein YuzE